MKTHVNFFTCLQSFPFNEQNYFPISYLAIQFFFLNNCLKSYTSWKYDHWPSVGFSLPTIFHWKIYLDPPHDNFLNTPLLTVTFYDGKFYRISER